MRADVLSGLSERLQMALLSMDAAGTLALLSDARQTHGMSQLRLADEVIGPALTRIGDDWEAGEVALSQVYMAGRIVEQAVGGWEQPEGLRSGGPVIGVGVLEDYHALGKRIVHAILRSAGHDARDLGLGLSVGTMVQQVVDEGVDVLMVSVLMFNKALHVEQLIEELAARGLGHVRVVVGGAPFRFDPDLWQRVGAHACGHTAADALRLVDETVRAGGAP